MDRLLLPLKLTSRFLFLAIWIGVAAGQPVSQQQAILKQYCVSCHSPQVKSGGLILTTQDLANPGAHAEVYEKVVRKLRAGVMPPAGMPRPPKPVYDGFVSWLETELDSAAAAHPGVRAPNVMLAALPTREELTLAWGDHIFPILRPGVRLKADAHGGEAAAPGCASTLRKESDHDNDHRAEG